ncbi:Putative multidrug export ATP-binding/permease protein [Aquisphaera giovannonii]|uniref:Multidrug export ATP-binding/permease protein n=1 Tax=Aquisphaera giovannonii TaxID=406548 RepID=A0A5B9W4M5_9BACT|nr:ABC transporter ATP-binding protein [Aquisphaera giovannonii]QEH34950.1 Putative multidrug export ATP-binding/permease protein [Aquisphaera giovannonii]
MSLHRRIGSRLRFRDYLKTYRERLRAPRPRREPMNAPGPSASGEEKHAARHRSLPLLYRNLYGLLAGQRRTLAASLLALSLATLLKLIPPAATKAAIDYVLLGRPVPASVQAWSPLPIPESPRLRLFLLVGVTAAVSVLGTMIGLWSRWLATWSTKRVQVSVRRKVYEHAMRLPLHRVYQLKSGGASSLLREDAGGVGDLVFSMLYNPWRAIVQFLGGLVVLAWVDWRLLFGALCLVPCVYYADLLWNRRIRPLHKDIRKQRQQVDGETTEVFGGMRIVRAFGRQRSESARFMGQSHYMSRLELYSWWLSRLVELLWELILPMASVGLLLYGGLQVLDGGLSMGDLMMFLVYLTMLLEPMAVLATSVTQLQNNLSGFDRVLDILEEPREMAGTEGHRRLEKRAVRGRITLEGVGFRYPGTDRLVLRDVDLDIEPGETIALVGRSGSGKTTLCNLVARFYDPSQGVVRLDGVDLREIEVESYRRILGIVEQDVFLFDGTIAENIAYGDRSASPQRIAMAAAAANAAEFIDRLPDGYDTLIGERGVRLSGGQRQRLAIARAILADPRVFILDEATSNLDSESERLIQQGLATLLEGRTSFVIAHRLSTIRHADRILVLENGEVVESGTHDELMAAAGPYRDMVELQRLESVDTAR